MRVFHIALAAISFFALIARPAMANRQWTSIAPLDYCPKFKMEYQVTSDGEYKVRLPSPAGPQELDQKLQNINDLSSLTDILVQESAKVCGDGLAVLRVESDAIYFEENDDLGYKSECSYPLVYTEPYLELTRDMVKVLQFSGNRCDQMMAYTELQTKITQLSDDDLIQLKNPSNLFHRAITLFTGPDTDKLIRMYHTCGGEKFTDKFVANLILLEAKSACVMPSPPGMFSFEETKEIALEIAKDYNNLSLTDMRSKSSEITQRAVQTLAAKGLRAQVNELLAPYVEDIDAFIDELDAPKELAEASFDSMDPEFLSLGFTLDATMEVAKKAAPIMAQASFSEMLPPEWSEQEKDAYMRERLLPRVSDAYAACIAEHEQKIGAGMSPTARMAKKKKLKANYCSQYPDQCRGESCSEKVNILSQDPAVADSQVAQGCVMRAMLEGVRPTIEAAIAGQKENLNDMFELTPELAQEFSDKTWKDLLACSNQRLTGDQSEPKDPLNPPLLQDPSYLQKTDPKTFENTLLACANNAQTNIARDFFATALANNKAFVDSFGAPQESAASRAMQEQIESILKETYDPCSDRQRSNAPDMAPNPLLCIPLVEISAASAVVGSTMQGIFSDAGAQDLPQARQTLVQFNQCSVDARQSALNSIGSDEAQTPIASDDDDAKTYLQRNNQFYNCVKSAVSEAVDVVGSDVFDKSAKEMESQLQNPAYMLSLKTGALNAARGCMEERLASQRNWPEFMAFNEAGGLDQAQIECSAKAMDYVLPKVLIRETAGQLAPLRDQGLVANPTQVGNILAATAFELRQAYDLKLPSHLKGDDIVEWSFAQAHNKHIQRPGNDTNTFVAEYTGAAMNHAIAAIHGNIKDAMLALPGASAHSQFFEALTPQCISAAYQQFESEISELTSGDSGSPAGASAQEKQAISQTFALALLKGLQYQKGLGERAYQNKLAQIRTLCADMDGHQNIQSLLETNAFDFAIKAAAQEILLENFESVATGQCQDDLKALLPDANFAQAFQRACSARDQRSIASSFAELKRQIQAQRSGGQQAQALRTLAFIQQRHEQMSSLIDQRLKDPKYLDRVVFRGSPSPILGLVSSNFRGLASGDESVMGQLSQQVATNLFYGADGRPTEFGEELVKTQLVNGFGISGLEQAKAAITREAVRDALGWRDLIVSKSKVIEVGSEGLEKSWTPQEVNRLINWEGMARDQRDALARTVFDNAIAPAAGGAEMDMDKIADHLARHAQEYRYPGSNKTIADGITDIVSDYAGKNKRRILGIRD